MTPGLDASFHVARFSVPPSTQTGALCSHSAVLTPGTPAAAGCRPGLPAQHGAGLPTAAPAPSPGACLNGDPAKICPGHSVLLSHHLLKKFILMPSDLRKKRSQLSRPMSHPGFCLLASCRRHSAGSLSLYFLGMRKRAPSL